MTYHLEPGGKDFAKRFILKWIEHSGGSNLKMLEMVTGLPVRMLEVLLNELILEGKITYAKCYRGVKVWRAI